MIIAPERFASRRDTLAFVVCILLSVVARVLPVDIQVGIASGITNTVLAPFLKIQQQVEVIQTARARVARVTTERDSVAVQALEVIALREENERLRGVLGLSARLPVSHVSADVLHQSSPTDGLTLLVSAGRNQGIRAMNPVVASEGLVGVVQSAGPSTSVVLVWAHPDFRASAVTADGEVFGIVAPWGSEGPSDMLMELRGVPFRELVPIGTRVFTSGLGLRLGGVFPRGIPIGVVTAVGEEREGWSRTYVVRPAVHPASISHVIILTGERTDVAASFEGVVP